jgi:uncharacterized phiE125 gp8 family phage protein
MMKPVLITAPAEVTVTLTEAKAWLWVDHSDHDTMITAMIAAATGHMDGHGGVLGRCLVTQTWRQDYETWSDELRLPFPGIQSITHVKYYDEDGTLQTVTNTEYELYEDEIGGVVKFKDDFDIPNLDDDRKAPVQITFVAGYGAASAVPEQLKAAIKMHVANMYAYREIAGEQMAEVPMNYWTMIAGHRRVLK